MGVFQKIELAFKKSNTISALLPAYFLCNAVCVMVQRQSDIRVFSACSGSKLHREPKSFRTDILFDNVTCLINILFEQTTLIMTF